MKDVYGNLIEREEVETIHLMMPCDSGCIHRFLFFPVRRSLRRDGYRQTRILAQAAFGYGAGGTTSGYGHEEMEIRDQARVDRLSGR